MSTVRRLRWSLAGTALALVLLITPQAQATHMPGFGHDNPLAPAERTSTSCSDPLVCLRVDSNYATADFAIWGNHKGTNAGSGGVLGSTSAATTSSGVEGRHTGGGVGAGVYGNTSSATAEALGVLGKVKPTSPGNRSAAVRGINNGTGGLGIGVWGSHEGGGWGGYFTASSLGTGVVAFAGNGGDGLHASSGPGPSLGYGVIGSTGSTADNAAGVNGTISSAAINAAGVRGRNTAAACCGMGVFGEHTDSGIGVYGSSPSGTGVSGSSTSGTGVNAKSSTGAALRVEGRTYFQSGNVGIGISSPVSKLHVAGNYGQLPVRTGAPPPTDCDETREAGRLVVRTDGTPNLYVCRGLTGWRGL